MAYSYPRYDATTISVGITTVDCQNQVRSWRLLRFLRDLLIPSCNCTFVEEEEDEINKENYVHNYYHSKPIFVSANTITGTIFGYRRGKVGFCIQTNPKSTTPILLLELAVPTAILAREMQGGILRIALNCNGFGWKGSDSVSLLSMPVWTMYCNSRKVGFAVKRQPSKAEVRMLRLMGSVKVGAGIIQGKELNFNDEIMYLRANFERAGSFDCESFHLIDPEGSIGQELSISFHRL